MKKYFCLLWILLGLLPLEAALLSDKSIPRGTRRYLTLRVEFQEDEHSVTTGNGRFMTTEWTGHDTVYAVDALPHDRAYFRSHLNFIDHYWSQASTGRIRIAPDDGLLLPAGEAAYTLSRQMRYYSDPDSLDHRLARLVYESVKASVDASEFVADNDGVIIYHAGVGQDFNIDLDDSPFDIPSFYFDENYLSQHLSAEAYGWLISRGCRRGIVLPETQNQLKRNIALNGTEILLTGMLLGLPPLYDTEFGTSGAGIFGLMDQGSNNGSGLFPVKASAFERCLLGAADPVELFYSGEYALRRDEVYKLPVSSNEYFLVEFRKNTGIWADSLYRSRDNIKTPMDVLTVLDSLDVLDYTVENGVLTSLSDYDVSLPASGLLIWHIVEPEYFGDNPNRRNAPFLNLVEADGGDDIGKFYNTLNASVNSGWKWDMWFSNNPAFSDNNPYLYKLQFNDDSHPDSRSVNNLPTGINIRNFRFYADSAVIDLEMDPPSEYRISGMVFDEFTTALPSWMTAEKALIGFRDSSLYLYSAEDGLREIYSQNNTYKKHQTRLLTQGDALLQVLYTDGGTEITTLEYQPSGMLSAENLLSFDYELDLDHLALSGDSLFLPALSAEDPAKILHTGTGSLTDLDTSAVGFVPYIRNGAIAYIKAREAAVMNDTLIYARDAGFRYYNPVAVIHTPSFELPALAADHYFTRIVPAHLNNDGKFEVIGITEYEGRSVLSAFNHYGYLLDGFPVYGNYTDIRVYYLGGEARILAYDPAGSVEIYNNAGERLEHFPAPVDAASLFMEQTAADSASLIADGSIYSVRSDSVFWGYRGKDATFTNAARMMQELPSPPAGDPPLVLDGRIYNYPNPAEGNTTRFRYYAAGAEQVDINIYRLNGEFVRSLSKASVNGQWNEIVWDISGESSGVFIAKITVLGRDKEETYFVKPAILK